MGTTFTYLIEITTMDGTHIRELFSGRSLWDALKSARRKWRYCTVRLAM